MLTLNKLHKASRCQASLHITYLTDRVLVGEGKPQRYGTQLENKDGKLTPYPLEDPENVDERRRAIGMSPL